MQPGINAPSFTETAYNTSTKVVGNVELSTFKGSYTVLLFYTGDFGPTLLADLITFQEAVKECDDELQLLAISTDTVESHVAFSEQDQLEGGLQGQHCILVEDKTGDISRKYQVYDSAHHKAFPSYIIIDMEGEVVASITNDEKVGGNMEEVLRMISACKLCDEECAWSTMKGTPSDWKPGKELVTAVMEKASTEPAVKQDNARESNMNKDDSAEEVQLAAISSLAGTSSEKEKNGKEL